MILPLQAARRLIWQAASREPVQQAQASLRRLLARREAPTLQARAARRRAGVLIRRATDLFSSRSGMAKRRAEQHSNPVGPARPASIGKYPD
jgi:hypothetical protein